ncbi:PEP-CTERM sorting domain-containing protein [Sphingomonas sp. ID1715]|uniref:PEPxxWA-CTERM sorting domain-containing protein n=1 Tax=Sphingomonas sp. ID1715 TaxID=1656898 RepID=UPI001488484F|nr:PEPxxWA-CTERM sorting domain-containing protein [Sphingomonas sp. ID1715]NNM75940.1 PEP-CTERM sorting domain-containing protein [Sphingomonas sp. ID1715]
MKKLAFAAIAALGLAGTADAAVLTLQSITTNGPSNFTYNYQATLGPDEGVRTGDRFVIFDFGGYITGSAFSGSPDLVASVQNTTPGVLVTPGFNDDPNITNLVFTYTGPDFRNTTGPLAPFSFPLIGANSTFGRVAVDAFFTLTTKNNPASERNQPIFTLGQVSVPVGGVPEPATWAMMIGGFSLVGASARRRSRVMQVTA